jgi:hypothetical protein
VQALVERLEKGRLRTQQVLGSLAPELWAQTVYEEPAVWQVRDLLAHFLSAEEKLLELARSVAAGEEGAPAGFDYDAFNAAEQERLKGRSAEALLPALDEARRATLAWLSTVSDDELDRVGRHPALGEVTVETMVTAIYGHQLLHMRDLQSRLP